MNFWQIYLLFCLVLYALCLLEIFYQVHRLKERYKGYIEINMKVNVIGIILSQIQLLIACFIPIFNISLFVYYIVVFQSKSEDNFNKMVENRIKNKEKK